MNNLEYLNYLLEKSREAIKINNKIAMRFCHWDLQDIIEQEPKFYKQYRIVIDSEIKALKRLNTCGKLPLKNQGKPISAEVGIMAPEIILFP